MNYWVYVHGDVQQARGKALPVYSAETVVEEM